MRCDNALPLLSAARDEPIASTEAAALDEHVAGCPDCQSFQRHLESLRRELRYETVDEVPDVAAAVIEAVTSRRAPRRAQVAAAFAAGLVGGAVFVGLGLGQPSHVAVADLPARVAAAQTAVGTLAADLHVSERGWHDEVPERTYRGTLVYLAPESLHLSLTDHTDYPSPAWRPNHTTAVTDGGHAWTSGPAACPRELLPACTPPEPRTRAVLGREPFDPSAPAPLDLVVPVSSFSLAAQPQVVGTTQIDGRPAVGVAVTAAQVAPLLSGLRGAGHWREIHPADSVQLWLDADALVPLALSVRPADDPERALWAARRGYRDPAGTAFFELRLSAVRLNEALPQDAFPPPPGTGAVKVPGFQPGPVGIEPAWLPDGLRPHRSGSTEAGGPRIEVASWSDGRAWLTVRRTTRWDGDGLFGDLGEAVRPVRLAGAGTAYVAPGGSRVGLRADGESFVVAGSVGEETLLRVTAGLGAVGLPLPDGELPTRGVFAPDDLEGFGAPGVRRSGETVTLVYTGPGDRWFSLTQGPGDELAPPLEPDVRGVQVRGTTGRYSPSLGELEWREPGVGVVSVRSDTLTPAEVVEIAERLERR